MVATVSIGALATQLVARQSEAFLYSAGPPRSAPDAGASLATASARPRLAADASAAGAAQVATAGAMLAAVGALSKAGSRRQRRDQGSLVTRCAIESLQLAGLLVAAVVNIAWVNNFGRGYSRSGYAAKPGMWDRETDSATEPGHSMTFDDDDDGEGPPLKTLIGVDYRTLRALLKKKEYKAADAETRRLLIVMSGKAAVKRGWIYFSEVKLIPDDDMNTVNDLWSHFSGGKFGFVQQRKIWKKNRGAFDKFAEETSWFTSKWQNRNWPDEFVYDDVEGVIGHLPLTNCIRGAQVLTELLSHPAFEVKRPATFGESSSAAGSSASAAKKEKKSAMSMLGAFGSAATAAPRAAAGSASLPFAGASAAPLLPRRAPRGGLAAAAAVSEVAEAPTSTAAAKLADLEQYGVINDFGIILPEVPDGAKVSAFLIYDIIGKPMYMGFSKDLRNTLRTLLVRRPELCYTYKCTHLMQADQAELLALRETWFAELGATPPGNKDPRQKNMWESPVDGGAMNPRAYKLTAEQKAKEVLRTLKDRGLKEIVSFNPELIEEGKVDVLPSKLLASDLLAQTAAVGTNTSLIETEYKGKLVKYEIYFKSEFNTNGGWWVDCEVTASKQKTMHRVVIGKEFAEAVGCMSPKTIVQHAFTMLLAKKVPMKTEGMLMSEDFPVAYFTCTTLATAFPEFLEFFGEGQTKRFDWDVAQWHFKQVHDYNLDDMRTPPVGPNGGVYNQKDFE